MLAGCPGDCAFPLVACPAPAGGDPCSDHGWCASAFGACQCWFGYTGDDCSQCAEGYIRSAQLPMVRHGSQCCIIAPNASQCTKWYIGSACDPLEASCCSCYALRIVRLMLSSRQLQPWYDVSELLRSGVILDVLPVCVGLGVSAHDM